MMAVISQDGFLRFLSLSLELKDTFSSYFGAFTCVCFSPDGNYVVTGGEDDLVSVWSVRMKSIVARCQGHTCFVVIF
jgi:WD40 repeat protein